MSQIGKQQQAGARALVPVLHADSAGSSFNIGATRRAGLASKDPNLQLTPARSTFLAQLAGQYERRAEAAGRRAEARRCATKCYDQPAEKTSLRHLVWA